MFELCWLIRRRSESAFATNAAAGAKLDRVTAPPRVPGSVPQSRQSTTPNRTLNSRVRAPATCDRSFKSRIFERLNFDHLLTHPRDACGARMGREIPVSGGRPGTTPDTAGSTKNSV